MRCVVSDTGPILHLEEAGALAVLGLLGEVCIPPAVEAELARAIPDWVGRRPPWLVSGELVPPWAGEARSWYDTGVLHIGEAEAIALGKQLKADWLLTDDAAARLFAKVAGLEPHGSLGIVLWAAAVGKLNRAEARRALDGLARSSLWVSKAILAEARLALGELFR